MSDTTELHENRL